MDIATLRSMSAGELKEELETQRRLMFGLGQGLRAGEVKDVKKYHDAKKSVAQIQTLMTEKESTDKFSNKK